MIDFYFPCYEKKAKRRELERDIESWRKRLSEAKSREAGFKIELRLEDIITYLDSPTYSEVMKRKNDLLKGMAKKPPTPPGAA